MEIKYIIITYGGPGDYYEDISWYDTYEEAYEDYDPLTYEQELYKVEKLIP